MLRSLYDRVQGPNADYSEALTRDLARQRHQVWLHRGPHASGFGLASEFRRHGLALAQCHAENGHGRSGDRLCSTLRRRSASGKRAMRMGGQVTRGRQSLRPMAIHTFNAFLAEQVDDAGDVNVTLAQFDNEYEVVYLREPVRQAPRRTADTYVPRGTKPFHGPMLALTRILRHASRAIIAP